MRVEIYQNNAGWLVTWGTGREKQVETEEQAKRTTITLQAKIVRWYDKRGALIQNKSVG